MRTPWLVLILRIYVIIAFFFIFAPVISLAMFSFQEGKIQSFPIEAYSMTWYLEALANHDIMVGVGNSVIVGVPVSVLSTVLGFLSAHLVCRRKSRSELGYIAFVSLPLVVPLLLSGMASVMYFQRIRLAGTLWAIVVAHTCFCSPFAFAVMRNPYERLNIELEQAASNLGASQWRVILQIVIPQLWPAITAAGLVSFLVSWDEFILAWFVGGFEKTLPVVIYGMMGTAFNPSLNAVGTVNVGISALVLCTTFILMSVMDRIVSQR